MQELNGPLVWRMFVGDEFHIHHTLEATMFYGIVSHRKLLLVLVALFTFHLATPTETLLAQGGGTSIAGLILNDVDGNGKLGVDDLRLEGWTVRLIDSATGKGLDQVKTNVEGYYLFANPPVGRPLQVTAEIEQGWVQTAPGTLFTTVTAIAGESIQIGNILVNTDVLVLPFNRPCGDPIWKNDCKRVTLTAGVADSFAAGNAEPATPSAALIKLLQGNPAGFDYSGSDRSFGHTFVLPQDFVPGRCVIREAYLTVRLRSNSSGSGNDVFYIAENVNGTFVNQWASQIATLYGAPWSTGADMTYTFNLANMPGSSYPSFPGGLNILSALQDGTLDILMQDDTGIDFARLDITYCCPVAKECDCLEKPVLDTTCCGYNFSLINNVGSPITAINYSVIGGTVSGATQTPCPFIWTPGGSSGSLSFGSGCTASPMAINVSMTPDATNGTGWMTLVLNVVHSDGQFCRIVQRFKCKRAPKSRCDSLGWSFYSFDPNNLSGRIYTIQSTKLPLSPITHVDVRFTPAVAPANGMPLVVNGGSLKVNGSPSSSTWTLPNYGVRIPNAPLTLSPAPTNSISFWLGIDRTQAWNGTVEFTVWHADGDTCILRSKWSTVRDVIDISDIAGPRKGIPDYRALIATTVSTPVRIKEGPIASLSLEPVDPSDNIFAVPGATLLPIEETGKVKKPSVACVTATERLVYVTLDTPIDEDEAAAIDSVSLPLVIEVDSGKVASRLRLTLYGPDGEPYGSTEILLDSSSSTLIAPPQTSDIPNAFHSGDNIGGVELFPNPVQNELTAEVMMAAGDAVTIEFFNLAGTLVLEQKAGYLAAGAHTLTVGVSQLPNGTYYVRFGGPRGTYTKLVTVQG